MAYNWSTVKGYESLTLPQRRQLERTFERHRECLSTEHKIKFAFENIKEVKWDARERTVNIYFKNGSWWHYCEAGSWY